MYVARMRLRDLLEEKRAREQKRISVAEVARQMNMKHRTAHRWFKNEVKNYPDRVIAAFCLYFECTFNDLFELRDEDVSQ